MSTAVNTSVFDLTDIVSVKNWYGPKYHGCIAVHPYKNIVAVGSSNQLQEIDLQSRSVLSTGSLKGGNPVVLKYTPDGNRIIVVLKEWIVLSIHTATMKGQVVMPHVAIKDRPLIHVLLEISGGSHPFFYLCEFNHQAIRGGLTERPVADAAAKAGQQTDLGSKLRVDFKGLGILGLAVHPVDHLQVVILTSDGNLRGYTRQGWNLESLFTIDGLLPEIIYPISLKCFVHPFYSNGALLVYGNQMYIRTWECKGLREQPFLVKEGPVPGMEQVEAIATIDKGHSLIIAGYMNSGQHNLVPIRIEQSGSGTILINEGEGSVSQHNFLVSQQNEMYQTLTACQGFESVISSNKTGVQDSLLGQMGLTQNAAKSGIKALYVHPLNEWIIIQMQPPKFKTSVGKPADFPFKLFQHTLKLPLITLTKQPAYLNCDKVSTVNTSLSTWLQPVNSSWKFPGLATYVSGGNLNAWNIGQAKEVELASLPDGYQAVGLKFADKKGAWLIFMTHGVSDSTYFFTLITQNMLQQKGRHNWMQEGIRGDFFGSQDEHYAVLTYKGTVDIFATQESTSAPSPLASLEVPGLSLSGDVMITRGPSLPRVFDSAGNELWLKYGPLYVAEESAAISTCVVPTRNEEVEQDPENFEAYPKQDKTKSDKQFTVIYQFMLRPKEKVIQMSNQLLQIVDNEGEQDLPTLQDHAVAVLTNQRIFLLSGDMQYLLGCQTSIDPGMPPSLPITCCMWMGPVLLVADAYGGIFQLCWDSSLIRLCTLQSEVTLLAAFPDRLLFVLNNEDVHEQQRVVERPMKWMQALLQGWATLVPFTGTEENRNNMKLTVEAFSAKALDNNLISILQRNKCGDLAVALQSFKTSSKKGDQYLKSLLACKKFSEAVELVIGEYNKSIYKSKTPPKTSNIYKKLVQVGWTAIKNGKVSEGVKCLKLAGQKVIVTLLAGICANKQELQEERDNGAVKLSADIAQQLLGLNSIDDSISNEWDVAGELPNEEIKWDVSDSDRYQGVEMEVGEGHTMALGAQIQTGPVAPIDVKTISQALGVGAVEKQLSKTLSQAPSTLSESPSMYESMELPPNILNTADDESSLGAADEQVDDSESVGDAANTQRSPSGLVDMFGLGTDEDVLSESTSADGRNKIRIQIKTDASNDSFQTLPAADQSKHIRITPPPSAAQSSSMKKSVSFDSTQTGLESISETPQYDINAFFGKCQQAIQLLTQQQYSTSRQLFTEAMSLAPPDHKSFPMSAKYLAASILLEKIGISVNAQSQAKMYRFVVKFVQPHHAVAFMLPAVQRNISIGNYGWSSDTLIQIVTLNSQGYGSFNMSEIQTLISKCDENGGRNANLPAGEDVVIGAVVSKVGEAKTPGEVQNLVQSI